MSAGLYMLADALLTALSAKLERDVVLARVKDLESAGATPADIARAIRKMVDEAEKQSQDEINRTPSHL